ncbi:DUF2059 domain-containing protein [Sungkyunkwania multivorans]|uniref:DUF2059 domain-containing protein n=1 Tax=Sungkyunkwania multivorans TaxID=1173618 RepID=A0ABW3CSH3_9FLAO
MKTRLFFLVAILPLISFAQTNSSSFVDNTLHYLRVNGTQELYEDAVDQLFVLLKQQYASQNVPESVWTELKESKTKSVNDLKAIMVSAYRAHFNNEDIKNMIAFYESDAGQQLKADRSKLTDEQRREVGVFYKTVAGQKIIDTQAELTKIVGQISQDWSSALYREMTGRLKEKGFTRPQ